MSAPLLSLRIQFLLPFQEHPSTDLYCFERTQNSFMRIGRVLQVNASGSDERMKLHMVLAAERHPEPSHVILTARVIALYPLVGIADHAP